ncbi:FliO/MopB family protein [Novosphingopyxis sp.]|uniref:FliO/MopB family protein n=1 Tax=Novosphingopyxis sp. TaxID=2709690 RepID=UPI003B5A7ED4
MTYYILKLVIMLPLMAAMIVGALWLYRKYQPGMVQGVRQRDLRLVETLSMGTSGKLAVVEFGDQRILLSATRGKIERIEARAMTEEEKRLADAPPASPAGGPAADAANPFAAVMDRALAARRSLRRDRD